MGIVSILGEDRMDGGIIYRVHFEDETKTQSATAFPFGSCMDRQELVDTQVRRPSGGVRQWVQGVVRARQECFDKT